MLHRSLRNWLIGFCVVATFCGISYGLFVLIGNVRLEKSIEQLLTETLRVTYKIDRHSIGDSITDQGGEWGVILNNDIGQLIVSPPFHRADLADSNYFKEIIRDRLLVGNLGEYDLYRADISLGKGSICETRTCNVYILYNPNVMYLYVGIYKS